jgi:hypothetical protein
MAPAAPRVGSTRVTAAVKALGGPAPKAPSSKGVGKATRLPKAPGQKAAAKMPRQPAAHAKAAPAARQRLVPNYSEGSLNEGQIKQIANNEAKQVMNAELSPLKGEAKEIQGNELGASERFQSDAGAANSLLSSVGQQQEASAKTAENQAADNALSQGKSIETSGQQQASMTAGYMSPELRAELNAEGTREAGVGAAGNTFAQNSAQAGSNLTAGIRGAAALRAVEGQQKVTGYFQKEGNKVQEDEGRTIAKKGADQASYEQDIAKENEKAYATNAALGLKGQETANKTAKTRAELPKLGAETRQDEAATRKDETETGIKSAKERPEIAKLNADAKEAEAKAKDELKKAAGGTLTTSEQDKYAGEIGAAYSAIQSLRTKGSPEAHIGEHLATGYIRRESAPGKFYDEKIPKIANPTLQKAAFELWKYHTVSPETSKALASLGLTLTSQQLAALVGL